MDDAMSTRSTRILAPAIMFSALTATAVGPASAVDDPFILPAGYGCPDFNLGLASVGGNLRVKEFFDEDGDLVRSIIAGKGVDLTYTNYGPDPEHPVAGESVTIKTAGSVTRTVYHSDGTYTVTATGHNGLILFPSDVPAGPTTTHYIGRFVYTVDPATGVFTLDSDSTTGSQRDICAELAS